MKLHFSDKPSKDSILLVFLFSKQKTKNKQLDKLLSGLSSAKEFSAKPGQKFYHFGETQSDWPKKKYFFGLGKKNKLNYEKTLSAIAGSFKALGEGHRKKISILLEPDLLKFPRAIGESLALSNYWPSKNYKTGKRLKKLQEQYNEEIEIVGVNDAFVRSEIEKGALVGNAVNEIREWVNAPPNFADVKFFEQKSKELAKKSRASLTVFSKRKLKKMGMGALLAVNRGSSDEARLIMIDYLPKGANKKDPPVVLVGKGIIFDSGGYNLKPRGAIEDMQLDKAGAATVLNLIGILPQFNIKKRVIAVAPLTANLIGPDAVRPSEIIKTYSGKTVEITNTDAEGRLILADAIAYAVEKYKPLYLIDVATLTGACVVALGDKYAGLFTNNKELGEKLKKAGDSTDELLWQLPIHKVFREKMKGYYADLRNAESESGAGASKGAAFLQEFVGKTPWAHLDIAGPAFTQDPKKYESKGATGFGLRVLLKFLEDLK